MSYKIFIFFSILIFSCTIKDRRNSNSETTLPQSVLDVLVGDWYSRNPSDRYYYKDTSISVEEFREIVLEDSVFKFLRIQPNGQFFSKLYRGETLKEAIIEYQKFFELPLTYKNARGYLFLRGNEIMMKSYYRNKPLVIRRTKVLYQFKSYSKDSFELNVIFRGNKDLYTYTYYKIQN